MTTTATKRVYNFSAGPAVLPVPVLEEAQRDLLSYPGAGMSVLEMSHRSKVYEGILNKTIEDLRKLANIPANYHILFVGGGASMQFSMVPMNLLSPGGKADYILTDDWSKKAMKEAKRVGNPQVAGSTESENFKRIPKASELTLDPAAEYVHFTSNNTLFGTEWKTEPEVGNVPLVCDASSDILSHPLDVNKYALIYAGAQKNIGPAGVTMVIIRDDMLARSPESLPTMLNYNTHAKNNSLYNTPPAFPIYIVGLVAKHLLEMGGLAEMQRRNEEKAAILYTCLDSSDFWRPHAAKDSRSLMNVTFRLPSEELEEKFIKEATAIGLNGLKGHRSVGGLRASIYNAFPKEGVEALVAFMKEFEKNNG